MLLAIVGVNWCRWDVVRPESSDSGDWEIVVSATRAIESDEEAWLSYSTEPGSYFLLHYGFMYAHCHLSIKRNCQSQCSHTHRPSKC